MLIIVYFQALAVSDFVLLVAVLVTDPIPYHCGYTGGCSNIWNSWPYVRYVWIITPISHMCSIWFVVLVGLNRFWAVCYPYAMARVWSLPRTLLYIAAVFIFVVTFNIPRFFEYQIISVNTTSLISYKDGDIGNNSITLLSKEIVSSPTKLKETVTNFGDSYSYRVVYKSFLVVIVLIVVPLLLLSALTINITHTLRLQSQRKQAQHQALHHTNSNTNSNGSGTTLQPNKHLPLTPKVSATTPIKKNPANQINPPNSSSDITTLLILVVIVAIVANTPLCIFHFVRLLAPYGCAHAAFYLESVSKLLVNINSCANFLLYCCFSPRFRNILLFRLLMVAGNKKTCCCQPEEAAGLEAPVDV